MLSVPVRYRVLLLYALAQALMQFEWLRFAPVASAMAREYRAAPSAIADLALVFPLLFVPLALPAGWWIDRMPVRRALRVGAAGMALAAAVRALGPDYRFLLAGQLLFAALQPLVMALIARLAATWFAEHERLRATEIPSMAQFAGIALAFVLVPALGSGRLALDAWVLGALAALTWLGVPPDPPTARPPDAVAWRAEVLSMLRAPAFFRLLGYFFLAIGYFNAISTWLEPILHRHGVSAAAAGLVAMCMLASGIVCMAWIDRLGRRLGLRGLLVIAALASIGVTAVLFACRSLPLLAAAAVVLGATLLAPLPLLIQAVASVAGARRAGTAVGMLWLAGNAGGAVFLAALGPLADAGRWTLAGILLAALLVVQAALAWRFRGG